VTPAAAWEIRSLRPGDVDAVQALECRTDGAAHWRDEEYQRMIDPSVARGVQRIACVAIARGSVLGFIAGRVVLGEAELENIAVEPEVRRQGAAVALMMEFLNECRRRRCSVVRLEVRESNGAARALYGKAGFREESRRKGYYRGPEEDAVVMSLAL
jgi:ribosomal-protein-alanine N-acetyltransferase